jgi:hypothetical protein
MFVKLEDDSQRSTRSGVFKVGIAFIGGFCLAGLSITAWPASSSQAESTNLLAVPRVATSPALSMTLHNLPGASPFKGATLKGIETLNRCDTSMNANALKSVMTPNNIAKAREIVARAHMVDGKEMGTFDVFPRGPAAAGSISAEEYLKAGQTAPMGFFDPFGLTTSISEGRLLFLREAEIKHGRVCMLATLGIIVGEKFHPLLGGGYDGPAVDLNPFTTNVPLADYWPLAFIQTFATIAFLEYRKGFSVLEGVAFEGQEMITGQKNTSPEVFAAKTGRVPGDYGFDPLGLKPKTEEGLMEVQNKEINNGRLAMLAALGILIQEAITGEKIFG